MRKDSIKRLLCALLCAVLLAQPMTASAWWWDEDPYIEGEEEMIPLAETPGAALQNGTAVIPAGTPLEEVKRILTEALIGPGADGSGLEWEYYCEGKTKIGTWGNRSWGSIGGFTTETGKLIKTTYAHPALADNGNGDYQVRLAGTAAEVTLVKLSEKPLEKAGIELTGNSTISVPYTEDGQIDFDRLPGCLFDQLVTGKTPADMTVNDVTIEYYAAAKSGSVGSLGKNWAPLGGGKVSGLDYPAISAGTEQQIRFTFRREGFETVLAETSVTLAARENAPYTLCDPTGSVRLPLLADLTVDYTALKEQIFQAVVAESGVLNAGNVTMSYYAAANSGSVGSLGKNWAPLDGGKVSGLNYPAISAGVQKIRISWPGSQLYAPAVIEADVEITDREQVTFTLKDAPYEVGMVFNDELGYDYDATARAIYEAVVASASPAVDWADVRVEYNVDLTGITNSFKPLSETDATGLVKFKDGTWEIRVSCADSLAYRGSSVTVSVTTTDSRAASAVVLKEGVSFTYNMDPAVMEQAIFDQVIDWESSALPARDTLRPASFEIQYKAQMNILDENVDPDKLGSLGEGTKRFMPIAGGSFLGISYAPMGAGEQQVQVAFKGSADYKPSENAQAAVTVNKASVKVRVRSDNIYAGQPLPENFITTDPADKFEFYTIYAGATSNVNLGIYLDLPDKYDNNKLIQLIDPLVEKITGRSFSKMLQDGVTLGELRKMFDSTELLELLEKVGVDIGAFGQILKVINALPAVTDSLRIGFGIPNRAGLYTVTVITDNKNYNTGVGVGALLVRMRLSGVKLTWNQSLGSKISAADAAEFDFGATLSCNGDVTIDQSGVHYLYSGFTSKWKAYSSTTTPPTEPGRYVMTVVTLGGNYQAAPITRSFQITK